MDKNSFMNNLRELVVDDSDFTDTDFTDETNESDDETDDEFGPAFIIRECPPIRIVREFMKEQIKSLKKESKFSKFI